MGPGGLSFHRRAVSSIYNSRLNLTALIDFTELCFGRVCATILER